MILFSCLIRGPDNHTYPFNERVSCFENGSWLFKPWEGQRGSYSGMSLNMKLRPRAKYATSNEKNMYTRRSSHFLSISCCFCSIKSLSIYFVRSPSIGCECIRNNGSLQWLISEIATPVWSLIQRYDLKATISWWSKLLTPPINKKNWYWFTKSVDLITMQIINFWKHFYGAFKLQIIIMIIIVMSVIRTVMIMRVMMITRTTKVSLKSFFL